MKHLLLALLFSVVSFSSMSQESKYPINYQIVYKHSYVKDSLNRDKKEEETMELLVGDNVTFFQAYNKGIRDSIIAAEDIDHNKGITYAIQSKTPFDLAYTIFHQNNMFTTRDSYISTLGREKDNSYYQEKIVLHWDLLPDTDSIHGLLVQKAQCKIGDLSWTAFFTPEISLPYGPYKFAGLPGLILKVEDNKGYFSFVITNIVQKTAKIQAFPTAEALKQKLITPAQFLKNKYYYLDNRTIIDIENKNIIITDESYKQKAILADQEALKKYNVWLEKFL